MMFLNEPTVQTYLQKSQSQGQKADLVKHLWRVHSKQMSFTQLLASKPESKNNRVKDEDLNAYMPTTQENKPPNTYSQDTPREFEKF